MQTLVHAHTLSRRGTFSFAPLNSQEFWDPPLTVSPRVCVCVCVPLFACTHPLSQDLGRDQARTMPRPEYLNNMAKDHLPEIEFWASPLRRTLLTGILSCPEATSWRLVESLREIAGHTLCDSRHK